MRAVNLLPSDHREETSGLANRSGGLAYLLLVVLAGVAVLAVLYGQASHQLSGKEGEAARLEAKAQSAQRLASGLAPYKSFVALREGREQEIVSLVNSRFDWAHTIGELGRVLPPGVSIGSVQGSAGGSGSASSGSASSKSSGAVASVTPPGSTPSFVLSGCAVSQSRVATLLTRLRLIDGVSGVELHSSAKSGEAGGGSSGGGGNAGCPAGDPSYSLSLQFQPLPTPPSRAVGGTGSRTPASAGGAAGAAGRSRAAAPGGGVVSG